MQVLCDILDVDVFAQHLVHRLVFPHEPFILFG